MDPWLSEPGSPRVVVTIPPLESMVKAVGGDGVAVRCLCTTTGPHHYQADAADSRRVGGADLFLAVGLTLDESFSDVMQARCGNSHLRYRKLGDDLPPELLRKLPSPIRHGDHVHTGYDPHVWLGLEQAEKMAEEVAAELGRVKPEQAAAYKENATRYVARLKALGEDGRKLLQGKKTRRILTHHDSLHYFAKSFGLEIAGVIQTGAGEEPTPRQFLALVKLCREAEKNGKPVGVIAVEPQYPKHTSARALQKELQNDKVKIELAEVDPLETADRDSLKNEGARWYENRMRANLQALADKLP